MHVQGPALSFRIATFNLENLDEHGLAARVAALRPILVRLRADILCLQEVNGQKTPSGRRGLSALAALLADTPYAAYASASTLSADGDPADVHNLVVLSRWPIVAHRQLRHGLVAAPFYRLATAQPAMHRPSGIEWERPLLHAEIALPAGPALHIVTVHLRAPLAAPVAGQKLDHGGWRTSAGWSEGFFLAAVKRAGQALEARLLADQLFDSDPRALVVVAGDFNADSDEMPCRILRAELADMRNAALAWRSLMPVEDGVAAERRFTVRYGGKKLMLDHLFVSARLRSALVSTEIFNDGLADEAECAGAIPAEFFHAPVVAEFALPAH